MIKRTNLTAVCILGLITSLTLQNCCADTSQAKRTTNKNVRQNTEDIPNAIARQADFAFTYIPNKLYKVYCQSGRLTDIQLQPGEEIVFIGGGDTARWMVDQALSGVGPNRRWHIYIKPLRSEISTNLVINTDRHSYHIELLATNWYTPIVAWVYPKDEGVGFLRNDSLVNEPVNNRGSRKYKICRTSFFGKYSWTPVAVYDDGCKTYIEMPNAMSTSEAPVLYVKSKGKLLMVNYRLKGKFYIVDRLFEEAEMRNGKEVIRIVKRK